MLVNTEVMSRRENSVVLHKRGNSHQLLKAAYLLPRFHNTRSGGGERFLTSKFSSSSNTRRTLVQASEGSS